MSTTSAAILDADTIPVIDIAPLRDGSDPRPVAAALHAASQGLGFIYVKGHGIPDEAIEAAQAAAFRFFRASPQEKAAVTVSKSHRGWLAQGGAKMADDAPADLKESFIWGIEDDTGALPDDHPLRGGNLWPSFVPDMQAAAMAYFWHAHAVAHRLMEGFALGLGLPADRFLRTADKPLSRASFVYYPPQPKESAAPQLGVGAHTDFGVLTVLCQDATGGLEVRTVSGEWIAAPPIAGTLVVNVGDLLARWTDGAYVSTPHRVINRSGRERLSLVLAYDPNPETPIDPRDIFGAQHTAREAPTTCGDYLVARFARAFAYRTNA
ncbi:MAG: 2-oxoglutarate and iron-dependent oxygenase domain-containing protein [Pseudomonadota bacterium]